MNTYGHIFRLTTSGESHGAAIGGVIDGMPAGVTFDEELLRLEMSRRRPGQSRITTARRETDEVEILSGIFEGKTTGTPIGFIVRNADHHSDDYDSLRHILRPSHADFTFLEKYGIRDHRGGGRSSARETLSRVVAGAFAKMALRCYGIRIQAWTRQVGDIRLTRRMTEEDLRHTEENAVRCPDSLTAERMERLILEVKREGDTIGGIVECRITGCPAGMGDPVFGKLHARLAAAMMGINAAKGFEYGLGFEAACCRGSQTNDAFVKNEKNDDPRRIRTLTNYSGGIQGGISNGEDIEFRVAFKPVATLLQEQLTTDTEGNATHTHPKGRHDPCVVPRAVPIVEAMAAITLLDALLLNRTVRINHSS